MVRYYWATDDADLSARALNQPVAAKYIGLENPYSTFTILIQRSQILLRVRGGHEVEPYPQHPPAAEAAYNCGPRRRAPRRRDQLQDTDGDHGAGDASSAGADGSFFSRFATIVPTSPSTCFWIAFWPPS